MEAIVCISCKHLSLSSSLSAECVFDIDVESIAIVRMQTLMSLDICLIVHWDWSVCFSESFLASSPNGHNWTVHIRRANHLWTLIRWENHSKLTPSYRWRSFRTIVSNTNYMYIHRELFIWNWYACFFFIPLQAQIELLSNWKLDSCCSWGYECSQHTIVTRCMLIDVNSEFDMDY